MYNFVNRDGNIRLEYSNILGHLHSLHALRRIPYCDGALFEEFVLILCSSVMRHHKTVCIVRLI